jgi:predicted RNase H-like HicB family nuclease
MFSAMANRVRFTMRVPVTVRQEGEWYYSSCPLLDVHSQGLSEQEARDHLIEALQLFVETCFEQGTLEQVLRDRGFEPGSPDGDSDDGCTVDVPLALVTRRDAEAVAC